MSTCSCGGVTIECPGGCGCLCASEETGDCVRWCEPADPKFLAEDAGEDAAQGGIVRLISQPDGSKRMLINAQVTAADADAPRYDAAAAFSGCLHGATRESLALVLNALHSGSVSAPADQASEPIDETVDGTIAELAERLGLALG